MSDTGNILGALSSESDNYQSFLNRGAAALQNFDTEELDRLVQDEKETDDDTMCEKRDLTAER